MIKMFVNRQLINHLMVIKALGALAILYILSGVDRLEKGDKNHLKVEREREKNSCIIHWILWWMLNKMCNDAKSTKKWFCEIESVVTIYSVFKKPIQFRIILILIG